MSSDDRAGLCLFSHDLAFLFKKNERSFSYCEQLTSLKIICKDSPRRRNPVALLAEIASHILRTSFCESVTTVSLNDRQRVVLTRLLEGFEGKMTTSKWAKLAKTSQDTAARDIARLVVYGILVRSPGGGRSTSYSLRVGSNSNAPESG